MLGAACRAVRRPHPLDYPQACLWNRNCLRRGGGYMKKGLLILAGALMVLAPMSASAMRPRRILLVVGPAFCIWILQPVLGWVLGARMGGSILCVSKFG